MRVYTQAQHLVRAAARWPVASVEVARRNALVSSTALAQGRAERHEVEEFLAAHAASWENRRALQAASHTA